MRALRVQLQASSCGAHERLWKPPDCLVSAALQGAFGDILKGVEQVDAGGGGGGGADVAGVDAHLDMLRPAIASYGASVEVRPWGVLLTLPCMADVRHVCATVQCIGELWQRLTDH